ncbi:2Fe-2S iron-sulfur cluster binding domain-containing protein [Amycolatopsis sp. RM579]|uniref:2Fe-2S iron-sulfur cluster binding domain-containing protein n=2 Tax=Amycolatopsis pithecellobii TaxID=664692 RepID=A0A6N7Z765_9PSEU|nr:2Fe-2S iron-sulfur cluster binding domain-containing protein [Amycolatopsis pithecellobii]
MPSGEHCRDLVVTGRVQTAERVVALTMEDPAGCPLPDWTPGAHVDLLLEGGTLVRQYSLCGAPDDRQRWRLGVLDEPGGRGGSRRVHESVHIGDRVAVRGPRNHFELVPAARYLFVAGGIGITPILPMIAAAEAADAQWRLHYGGRSRAAMAFLGEVERYGDRVSVRPMDEQGLLPLAEILGTPSPGTLVYCCGPESLLLAVEESCAAWPPGSLHVERFAPQQPVEPSNDTAFEVECRRSGVTVDVGPGQTILQALKAAGIGVMTSCEEGICGTCETRVLDGIPEHRDSVLDEAEQAANTCMMICVGRARTPRLVLDL